MSFEGSGKSKKDAKLNASKALLVHLHQVGFDPMTGDMMSTQQNNTDIASGHSFADKIGQLVTMDCIFVAFWFVAKNDKF